jgi:hypothetical protein
MATETTGNRRPPIRFLAGQNEGTGFPPAGPFVASGARRYRYA